MKKPQTLRRRSKTPSSKGRRLVIEYVSIVSIVPNPNNPRRHSPAQIGKLAGIIGKVGFNSPILVDDDNQIIAGHGRWSAAKFAKHKSVPIIRLSHLTPQQRLAYMVADNKLSDESDFDEHKVALILKELSGLVLDFEIELTGFDPPEIDFLLQSLEPPEDVNDPADGFKLANGPSVSVLGDLWRLGEHRLYCGTALEGNSYRVLIRGELAAAVFTDPPYNVRIKGHVSGKGASRHREFVEASGEKSPEEFREFLWAVLMRMAENSVAGATFFVCMDWRHVREMLGAADDCGYLLLNVCVWVKPNGGMGSLYRSRHELVFVLGRRCDRRTNNVQLGKYGRNRTNVWNYPGMNSFARRGRERALDVHPTVKPIAMVADAILDVTQRGDIVLDPFCGSGTTILAAERTGRRCYAIELDPLYVDAAVARWQRMTGKKAIHESGKTFDEICAERNHEGVA